MRARIVAIVVAAGVLTFGLAPGADASGNGDAGAAARILCGGVRSLDVGFCLDNPLRR